MIKTLTAALIAIVVTSVSLSSAGAQVIDLSLSGNTSHDRWTAIKSAGRPQGFQSLAGYGGFPGSGVWPGTISSNPNGGDAYITKGADGPGGGAYVASGSIYFGAYTADPNMDGGTIIIKDNTPIAELKTIIFQIELAGAGGYEFFNSVDPTLTITTDTGTFTLASTFAPNLIASRNAGSDPVTGSPLNVNTWVYQWNIDPALMVTGFEILVNPVQHTQIYSMQLDQSDVAYAAAVVPEPSTWCILFLSAGVVLFHARRKRAFLS